MKILVTGAGKSLGTHVCSILKDKHEVITLSRNKYEHLEEMGVKNLVGDIRDKSFLEQNLTGIEAIIHLASKSCDWGSYEDFYQTNVVGTKTLLEICTSLEIKYFVYSSCINICYTKEDQQNLDEAPINTEHLSFYTKTKAQAESIVTSSHGPEIKTISIRLPLLWTKDIDGAFNKLIEKAREGKLNIIENQDILKDIIYYKNAANAFVNALNALIDNSSIGGESYNVSQEEPVRIWELINQVLSFYQIDILEDIYSFNLAYRFASFQEMFFKFLGILKPSPNLTKEFVVSFGKHHYFSNEKANKAFNYFPEITIESALRELYGEKLSKKITN